MNSHNNLPDLESLNQQYYSLAAFLGDIVFKIQQHDKAIEELAYQKQTALESIEALNKLAAKLGNVNLEAYKTAKTAKTL
jgi:hypothetical protein